MRRFFGITGFLCTLILLFGCDGGSNSSSPGPRNGPGGFDSTIIEEGAYGDKGRYVIEFYENAKPAQRQIRNNDVPNAVKNSDWIYTIDFFFWPEDWEIGNLIALRMEDGSVEYKRLITKFELPDGQLAIGVEKATLLEAVDRMELDSESDVTRYIDSNRAVTSRRIVDYDFKDSMQIEILDEKNLALYEFKGKYEDGEVNVFVGFPIIKLSINPEYQIYVSIDTPPLWEQIKDKARDLKETVHRVIEGEIKQIGTAIYQGGVIIISAPAGIAFETADAIMEAISRDDQYKNEMAVIRSVLLDRTRLKRGNISLAGDITGTVQIGLKASGKYKKSHTTPFGLFLFPIAGPIPIFLEFEPGGVVTLETSANVDVNSGLTVSIPIYAGIEVINGQLMDLQRRKIEAEINVLKPSFNDTKGDLKPSVGIQVKGGLTVAKMLSANVTPTASIVLDTEANVTGDIMEGCLVLNWDLYGQLTAKATGSFSVYVHTWEKDLKLIDPPFFWYRGISPKDIYRYCWGRDSAIPIVFTNSIGMTFNYIEPGTFMMGSPSNEPGHLNSETQHQVTLTRGYQMQTSPVTQGQWVEVMGNNPSWFSNCGSDCPVEMVSWNDAQSFITALNALEETNRYALPTEAQWEYAARAGSTTAFAKGQITHTGSGYDPVLDSMGWYWYNSNNRTHSVAQKEPNAWGLYDMHGNVWEWVADWYGDYPATPVIDPAGPASGDYRVGRGGSWFGNAIDCRSAARDYSTPGGRFNDFGFRLVLLPGH